MLTGRFSHRIYVAYSAVSTLDNFITIKLWKEQILQGINQFKKKNIL